MRTLLTLLSLSLLSGCAGLNKINYNDIDAYMRSQPTLSTPRDGLMIANLNCFSDFDKNGAFDETVAYSYQGFLSEGVYTENFYLWDAERTSKEDAYEDVQDLKEQDAEGVIFEYFFEEDFNGEYVAEMNLTKRTFIKAKKIKGKNVNVFKHIEYNKEYYPKNKQPIKVYEDSEEVCYVTASW